MVRSSVKWQRNILLSSLRAGKWFLLFFICQVVKHSNKHSTSASLLFLRWKRKLKDQDKDEPRNLCCSFTFFSMKWALHDVTFYLKFRVRCGISWFDKLWYKFVTSLSGGTRVCIVLFTPLSWLCWHFLSAAVLIFSWMNVCTWNVCITAYLLKKKYVQMYVQQKYWFTQYWQQVLE